ncbi:unnamed protein product [Spirodela intermedia]|uniref:Uncharacterized protein n=1 Tax=Spirodela intermedia TaxID=51605 RepID=A0A7I8K1R2_SPIIN|nr:unnamed protein product [Spirodela intermedia]
MPKSAVVVPAGADLRHAVLAEGEVGAGAAGVAEGAAADGVDAHQEGQHHHVQHRYLVPVPPHLLQHAGSAGIALVAQHRRLVAPPTRRRRREMADLDGGEIALHVVERGPGGDHGAGLGGDDAATEGEPAPGVGNAGTEPWVVVLEVVLAVDPAGDLGAAAAAGHGEPEDSEAEEDADEEEHDAEVEPERPRDVEAGADEAGQGDEEDDEADHQQRRLEEPLAGGAAAGHPEAPADDGDGRQHRQKVQVPDHRVTEPVIHPERRLSVPLPTLLH